MPLPTHTPRDDAATLTAEENESLDTAMAELGWPLGRRMSLVAFMREVEWDEDEVVTRARKLDAEVNKIGTIPVADVLPYMSMDDQGRPSPCGVLLEDGHGNCARDKRGNPVVVIYGNFECSAEDAIRQMVFLNQRMQTYLSPSEIPHVTYVFDMQPRVGMHDMKSNAWDLAFLRFVNLFPQSFDMYVCAAPTRVMSTLNMVPSWLMNNLKASASYDILADVMDPAHMLPAWHPHGSFDFTLDAYVTQLKAEELK